MPLMTLAITGTRTTRLRVECAELHGHQVQATAVLLDRFRHPGHKTRSDVLNVRETVATEAPANSATL
jgi:hypothetical protein